MVHAIALTAAMVAQSPQALPPLRLPHFDLPAGWVNKPDVAYDGSHAVFVWHNGQERLLLSIRPANGSLQETVDGDMDSLHLSTLAIASERSILNCEGEPAFLVTLKGDGGDMGTNNWAFSPTDLNSVAAAQLYVFVHGGREYGALFTARDFAPPAREITRSLESLCPAN